MSVARPTEADSMTAHYDQMIDRFRSQGSRHSLVEHCYVCSYSVSNASILELIRCHRTNELRDLVNLHCGIYDSQKQKTGFCMPRPFCISRRQSNVRISLGMPSAEGVSSIAPNDSSQSVKMPLKTCLTPEPPDCRKCWTCIKPYKPSLHTCAQTTRNWPCIYS